MSRRKQSNPKPLKREDMWGSDEEGAGSAGGTATEAAPRSPASATSGGANSRGEDEEDEKPLLTDVIKMEISISPSDLTESAVAETGSTGDPEPVASPPLLRLRLNTSLATDPAQRKEMLDRSSPEDSGRVKRSELDLLPGAAFPSVAVSNSASALFCLPPTPDANHVLPAGTPTLLVKQEPSADHPTPPVPQRQVTNCYICQPCRIRFSSKSTLEAHQTYYCSHRASALAAAAALQTNSTRSISPSASVPGSSKGESDGELGSPRSGGPAADEDAPATKAPRTGRQYACPHCSYSADKKVSLNRHMRMHAPAAPCPSPSPVTPSAPSDSENTADEGGPAGGSNPLPPPPLDRYCTNCDIRFSTVKTYRAHKTHYCSTRHVVKPPAAVSPAAASQASSGAEDRLQVRGSSASSPAGSPPAPTTAVVPQPFLALPTTPVLLVPYQLVQAASLVSSHALPPGAANAAPGSCLLLVDGAIRPLTLLAPTLPPPPPPVQQQVNTSEVTVTAPPPLPPPRQVEQQPTNLVDAALTTGGESSSTPLDLSVPRSTDGAMSQQTKIEILSPRPRVPDPEDEKENRGLNTSSPSLCSSPSSSPSSASPRPPRQNGILPSLPKKTDNTVVDRTSSSPSRKTPTLQTPSLKTPKQPVLLPELLGPFLGTHLALLPGALTAPLLSTAPNLNASSNHVAPPPTSVPQILVKQGVSRCAECNIVFCKMENYIAHKKHYCSARRTEDSSSPENGVVTAKSASPSPSPGQPQAATPPIFHGKALLQYICAPCGIKFTTFDNLKAHQRYYCLKRDMAANNTANTNNNEPSPERKKCPKCKVLLPTDESASPHQCVVTVTGGNSWRCPCCGVSSPTATAAQKHLEEAHAGVLKAFRCTICRYRGNTLRGMRTHIRMHFSAADKVGDMREEDYISCVLVGEPEPRPAEDEPASPERGDEVESRSKPIGYMERNHACDQCNYSSNYKGNLLRHMKSVHHRNIESEDTASLTPPPAVSNVSTPSPESLVVKLEPSEEKISFTEDPPPPPPSSVSSNSPISPAADVAVPTASRYCQPSGTLAPAPSPPVSPAASPAATTTPRPEASAHT